MRLRIPESLHERVHHGAELAQGLDNDPHQELI